TARDVPHRHPGRHRFPPEISQCQFQIGVSVETPARRRLAYNHSVLTECLEFAPERDAEVFSAVPAAPAVFLLRGADPQAQPYVSKTTNLRRRLQRLLGPVEHSRRLNLRDRVR